MTFLIALLSLVVVLLVTARLNQELTEEDWETLFVPEARRALLNLKLIWEAEAVAYDWGCEAGAIESRAAPHERVRELLRASYVYLAELVPDRVDRLRAAARYSRMLRAIAPLPHLSTGGLQLAETRRLAIAGYFVGQLLVGARERLRFRLFLLQQLFGTLLESARPRDAAAHSSSWQVLAVAGQDLRRLDHQTLECLTIVIRASCLMTAADEIKAREGIATTRKAGARQEARP